MSVIQINHKRVPHIFFLLQPERKNDTGNVCQRSSGSLFWVSSNVQQVNNKVFTYYLYLYYRGNASSYCQYAFELFDRDNNGTLSFTEFVFAMQIYSSNNLENSIGLVWTSTDSCSIFSKKMFVCVGIWHIWLRQVWNNRRNRNNSNDYRYKCAYWGFVGETRCRKLSQTNHEIMRQKTDRKDNENRIYQWVHIMYSTA